MWSPCENLAQGEDLGIPCLPAWPVTWKSSAYISCLIGELLVTVWSCWGCLPDVSSAMSWWGAWTWGVAPLAEDQGELRPFLEISYPRGGVTTASGRKLLDSLGDGLSALNSTSVRVLLASRFNSSYFPICQPHLYTLWGLVDWFEWISHGNCGSFPGKYTWMIYLFSPQILAQVDWRLSSMHCLKHPCVFRQTVKVNEFTPYKNWAADVCQFAAFSSYPAYCCIHTSL